MPDVDVRKAPPTRLDTALVMSIDAARSEARVMWQGNDYMTGEGQDPWNALAFRDREALDERFEALAEQLYGPALDALQGSEEDEA